MKKVYFLLKKKNKNNTISQLVTGTDEVKLGLHVNEEDDGEQPEDLQLHPELKLTGGTPSYLSPL